MAKNNNKDGDHSSSNNNKRRKRRWGEAPSQEPQGPSNVGGTAVDPQQKILAMKANIAAKLAAAKAKREQQQQQQQQQQQAASTSAATTTAAQTNAASQRPSKRAKRYDLDLSVTAPTFEKVTAVPASAPPLAAAAPIASRKATPAAAAKPAKKKQSNPYLSHLDDENDDNDNAGNDAAAVVVDDNLARAAKGRGHKPLNFVQPGTFVQMAEIKREKAALAAASGFVSGRKSGHTIQASKLSAIYGPSGGNADNDDDNVNDDPEALKPRWDAHPDTKMPLAMEWWDAELLPISLRRQLATAEAQVLKAANKAQIKALGDDKKQPQEASEGTKVSIDELREQCFAQASISHCKTATLVQHIVPVIPPNADTGPPKEAVLPLTNKERKRLRKLKREQRQREQQDLQAAGLAPAPEPRLTLQNFIRVLGDQAYLDPSQMEHKVAEQMQARQQAHWERNQGNKLTKEAKAAKRARKLQEDTRQSVAVALFRVKDLRHPLLRAKIDLNAQQNNVTGGVIEYYEDDTDDDNNDETDKKPKSTADSIACVVLECGPKAMKRMKRLMLVRMAWRGSPDDIDADEPVVHPKTAASNEDNEDGTAATAVVPQKFNPDNTCELVWEGLAPKRLFTGFVFQQVSTLNEAKKIFKNKGVAHYWDQVLCFRSGNATLFPSLQLYNDDEDDDNLFESKEDEDIVMKDS